MNIKFNQHIGIFENIMSPEWCNNIINLFEENKEQQFNRQKGENNIDPLFKNDTQGGLGEENINIVKEFYDNLNKKILVPYDNKYNFDTATKDSTIHPIDFKVQRTLPTEGYHVWHYENSGIENCNRFLTWSLYLNDVIEGGETEFLHQSLRIKPTTGTVVVWPAAFTHIHRGNPPLSGSKYIVTGWVNWILDENKK